MNARENISTQITQRWGWLVTIIACLLAHGWCVRSIFFLDDAPAITQNPWVQSGEFWHGGLSSFTILGYVIQAKLFGFNSAAFHAVNLLLHIGCALALWRLSIKLLDDSWPKHLPLGAALLFAVHPLASEIPNYARTQDLAWVTLFCLLGCNALLSWLRGGRKIQLVACMVCVVGATFSKGPGLFHAAMMLGAVAITYAQRSHWSLLRSFAIPLGCGILLVLLGVFFLDGMGSLQYGVNQWFEPRFIGHAYTIARVFWEFAWRCVVPIHLSADHHIAETLVKSESPFFATDDGVAQLAMLGMIAATAWCIWLMWKPKSRVIGLAFFLAASSISFRVLYLIPEFMPEYRIYPGMPWLCLGLACLISRTTWLPQMTTWAVILILCTVGSAQRSFVWHDLDRLLDDVLLHYPTQARAIWELHDRDLSVGKYQSIIERQETKWPQVEGAFHAENRRLAPARELPTGHFALAEVACSGRYARALAASGNIALAEAEIDRMTARMQQLGMHPVAHAMHWQFHRIDRALVLEMAGKNEAALVLLEQASDEPEVLKHRMRIREKMKKN